MRVPTIRFAGVAQRRERLVQPGGAGSAPAPRSTVSRSLRAYPTPSRGQPGAGAGPVMLVCIGLAAGVATIMIALAGVAGFACCGGLF